MIRDGRHDKGVQPHQSSLKRFAVFNTDRNSPEGMATTSARVLEGLILPHAEAKIAQTAADFRIGGERAFHSPNHDFIQVSCPDTYFEPIIGDTEGGAGGGPVSICLQAATIPATEKLRNSNWGTTMARILMPAVFASALLATCVATHAADLGPVYQAAPVAIPAYNWTGFYLGINGGYGWGQQNPLGLITSRFDSFDYSINGGMFGGTFGAQIQSGRVVLGVEGDIDWASITGSGVATPTILGVLQPTVSLNSKITSVSTARLRVGYAADNWLFYGTGGLALMGTDANATTVNGASCGSAGILPCSGNPVKGGLALGGGVEWGFAPNWSTKLEYLYIAQIDGVNTQYVNTIRAGINFRFGGN